MAYTKHPADVAFVCTFCTTEEAERVHAKYVADVKEKPSLAKLDEPKSETIGFPTSRDLHKHNITLHCTRDKREPDRLTYIDHRSIISQELTGRTLTTYFNKSEFHTAGVLVCMPATEQDGKDHNIVTRKKLRFSNTGKFYKPYPGTHFN